MSQQPPSPVSKKSLSSLHEAGWWVVLVALLAAAHVGGKAIGHGFSSSSREQPSVAAHSPAEEKALSRTRPAAPAEMTPEERRHRLERLLAGTPDIAFDDEAQADLRALLRGMSSAELSDLWEWQRKMPRGKDAMSTEILTAWLDKDPAAALTAQAKSGWLGSRTLLSGSWQSWCGSHPEKALAFLDSPDFPASLAGKRDSLRALCLGTQLQRNFDLVADHYAGLPPDKAAELLRNLGPGVATDPALREKLSQLADRSGRSGDQEVLQLQLVRCLQGVDPGKVKDYVDSPAVPDSVRTQAEAFVVSLQKDGLPAMFEWATAHPDMEQLPDSIANGIHSWIDTQKDAAFQWFSEQPAGRQRDLFSVVAVAAMAQKGEDDEARELISNISDPDLRADAESRFRALKELAKAIGR